MDKLKVMVLNAQDLFLFMDKHDHEKMSVLELTELKWQLMSSSLLSNKSKEKTQILAQTILEAEADIVMVTEVGGKESLENFSKFLLNDQYIALSLPSNSDRGIDMGYLVKKTLPYEFSLTTYVNYKLPLPAKKFSRDVLQLNAKENGVSKFIFLLVHIKSKLDMNRSDFEGRSRRVHEVKGLIDIYNKLSRENPDIPIFVGGDMNGHAGEKETEEEYQQLYQQTDLQDCAFVAGIPEEERFSYVYFNRGGQRFVQQIDYLFLAKKFASRIIKEETYFPRYKNMNGVPYPIPQRIEQKNTLPSDHYPFLTSLTV